jgi:hypothetical protein
MKPILYIKGSTVNDVRLQKFISFFRSISILVMFWGWDRMNEDNSNKEQIFYLLKRGGYNNKFLFLYYPLWMIIVFFKTLFFKKIKNYNIICINFECGLPVYLASHFRKIDYIYEVYDEFALSHNFPAFFKKILIKLDHKIIDKAKYIIHVDENRVSYQLSKSVVVENTPFDYYKDKKKDYGKIKHSFAIIGNISNTRGIDQIFLFARDNPHIDFILAGTFYDEKYKSVLLSLSNVRYYDRMPQNELFPLLEECCGIFSLYNPILEINRLAASNKVYDAMMLGIPVITNPEVVNSAFIKEKSVGIILNYNYDLSWHLLSRTDFIEKAIEIGRRGRQLYLEKYQFEKLIKNNLLNILE